MKTSLLLIISALCAVALIACAPATQKYYEKKGLPPLSVQQLEAELIGKTVYLESIEFDAFVSFKDDQALVSKSPGGNSDRGRWSFEGEDIICMEFSSWYFGDKHCYRIIKDNNQYIFFSANGARRYTGTLSSSIKSPTVLKKKHHDSSYTRQRVTEKNGVNLTITETPLERKQRFIRLAKNCPGCNLSGVDLSDAQLNRANLAGANLSGANLTNTELRHANLKGADLSGAILVRANLPGADLSFSNVSHADLSGSNLIRANVTGATFKDTKLTGALLESIQGTIQ